MEQIAFVISAVYIFVVGMCIGSFLNVVIYRVPLGISVAKGRSFCPKCSHSLAAKDLVPIFSWLWLRGRCRYCGDKISPRYMAVELLGGALAIAAVAAFGLSPWSMVAYMSAMVLVAVAVIDFDTMEIPNSLVLCLIIPTAAAVVLQPQIGVLSRIIGFFIVSLPMLLLTVAIPDCFGGGDIKLIAVCGALLGSGSVILATFIALILGGGYGVWLLKAKGASGKSHFAFGPFLAAGCIFAIFYGEQAAGAYLRLLS